MEFYIIYLACMLLVRCVFQSPLGILHFTVCIVNIRESNLFLSYKNSDPVRKYSDITSLFVWINVHVKQEMHEKSDRGHAV